MKPNVNTSERGQAIVLLAVGFVMLLGFTALAIDGGMVYADRRQAQNAADSAALAAALAIVNGQDWSAAALNRANTNGYDNNGVTNTVQVFYPPASGQYAGDTEYVQVIIIADVDTALIHFVYSGPVQNTVEAVARAKPGSVGPLFNGDAIVGLKPEGCDVVWKHGNSKTTVTGGGIWTNSNDPNCAFRYVGGAGSLSVPAPHSINVVGGASYSGGTPDATVVEGAPQFPYPPLVDIVEPTCSGEASWDPATNTLSPGNWSGNFPPDRDTTLAPGIFCITDTDFRLNANDTLVGNDVLIYMAAGGNIHWSGQAEITLAGRSSGEYKGLLLYVAHQNYASPGNCRLTINGSADSTFVGTIYAPTCDISFLGCAENTGFRSQLVGYTVEVGGDTDLDIFYDADENYEADLPPEIELTK